MQEEKSYSPEIQEISYNPAMKTQDEVRDFILQKSQEVPDAKGALATWSRAIGRNEAYLHQFIDVAPYG